MKADRLIAAGTLTGGGRIRKRLSFNWALVVVLASCGVIWGIWIVVILWWKLWMSFL